MIEYSACKEVAAQLGSRARDLYTVAREPMPLVGAAEYTRRHDPNWLVQAWFNLMGRSTRKKKPRRKNLSRSSPRRLSPSPAASPTCCAACSRAACKKWASCSAMRKAAAQNVATFLALLELIRAGRVKVDDSGTLQLDRTHRRRKDKTP